MNIKHSPVWKMSKDDFAALVARSKSCGEVLLHFGLVNKGGNYKTVRSRIKADELNTCHFVKCYRKMVQKNLASRIPLSEILVEHSSYNRTHLKKRLIRERLLKNECLLCGQGPEWKGKPLVMVLDHVNGVGDDHRSDNVRLLCPNCNSQQDTFAGRNNVKVEHLCRRCGRKVKRRTKSGLCRKCVRL